MKKIQFLAVLLLSVVGFALPAAAEEAKATTYVVEMTGVTWAGCKKYVRGAFKNLDGIVCKDVEKDIAIVKGKKKGTQLVTLKATKALTKEAAVKAIGAKKDQFVVQAVKAEKS